MDEKKKKFNWGISDDQIEQAEKLLGNRSLDAFVERRKDFNDYYDGRLIMLEDKDNPVQVMVSRPLEGRPFQRSLISIETIPKIWFATLEFEREHETVSLEGRVEASRSGQRSQDRLKNRTLHITRFHQNRE